MQNKGNNLIHPVEQVEQISAGSARAESASEDSACVA